MSTSPKHALPVLLILTSLVPAACSDQEPPVAALEKGMVHVTAVEVNQAVQEAFGPLFQAQSTMIVEAHADKGELVLEVWQGGECVRRERGLSREGKAGTYRGRVTVGFIEIRNDDGSKSTPARVLVYYAHGPANGGSMTSGQHLIEVPQGKQMAQVGTQEFIDFSKVRGEGSQGEFIVNLGGYGRSHGGWHLCPPAPRLNLRLD